MIIQNTTKCQICNKAWSVVQGIIPNPVKCIKCNAIKELCFVCVRKRCNCGGSHKSTTELGTLI